MRGLLKLQAIDQQVAARVTEDQLLGLGIRSASRPLTHEAGLTRR